MDLAEEAVGQEEGGSGTNRPVRGSRDWAGWRVAAQNRHLTSGSNKRRHGGCPQGMPRPLRAPTRGQGRLLVSIGGQQRIYSYLTYHRSHYKPGRAHVAGASTAGRGRCSLAYMYIVAAPLAGAAGLNLTRSL